MKTVNPKLILSVGLAAGVLVSALSVSRAEAADYAPLDCAKAGSSTEKAICSDYGLGQQEARVATLFEVTTSLVAMGQRGDIQDQQRAFLKERNACKSNISCLRNAYEARDKQLEAVLSQIRQRGPF